MFSPRHGKSRPIQSRIEFIYIYILEIRVHNKPLASLPNLFSVITVITQYADSVILLNMPIPFKFDSCKNFETIEAKQG